MILLIRRNLWYGVLSGDTADFLTSAIDVLLKPQNRVKNEVDINAVFAEYDRELMSMKPYRKRRTWPEPVGKR